MTGRPGRERVLTVTPNPSVDRTLELAALERGAVLRATSTRIDPGGKGVNVTRALVANGHDSLAVLPLGGADGELLRRLLTEEATPHRAVPAGAPTRTNITLREPDGTVTKVNAPGARLDPPSLAALVAEVVDALPGAAWLVLCGSLPAGAPVDLYATLTEEGHAAGVKVAVDASGPPLAAALAARPDLLKPNLGELAELVGRALRSTGDAVAAAAEVHRAGAGTVLVSLGADGALLVDGAHPMLAVPAAVDVQSDVGAGDALLAGFLSAGASGPEALRTAVAWGAAAVALPGTGVPGPAAVDASAVTLTPARAGPAPPLTVAG